jgi:hypothetical protein
MLPLARALSRNPLFQSNIASAKPAAKGKKRKKAVVPPEILAEVPQPSQWHSADQSKHHKQKLSKYRYVTKADKRKVANGPQYAAKIFVFNEGIPSEFLLLLQCSRLLYSAVFFSCLGARRYVPTASTHQGTFCFFS